MAKVPENPRKITGANLVALIHASGYRTLELFAHENGIDKSWLGRVVSGKIEPGFYKMIALAKALGVSIDEFYPGKLKKP